MTRKSAVQHLREAQQHARTLEDLLASKGLEMLAREVHQIELRIVLALDELARATTEVEKVLGLTRDPEPNVGGIPA